jgi:hypothetical protein
MGLPEFKAEEHLLFRIFMIQDQATLAVPVVTKKEYERANIHSECISLV